MTESALAARGVSKRFPGVLANDAVEFQVQPGEVHALLGENGSGKTTLCRVLTGLYQPDEGEVLVGGSPVRFGSPADAYASGIFMVHQHFSLVDRMTVAENVVLGWSPDGERRFDRRTVEARVAEAAERFHMDVDPRAYVWQLSIGERQRVEILKALYRGARTLILDEPTTVLTPQEVEGLFGLLRRMVADGASVVFISHKLDEVLAVCDRVTVLRDGRVTGTLELAAGDRIEPKQLARLMVGREIHLTRRNGDRRHAEGEPVLQIRDLVVCNDYGRPVVKGVSLDVHQGEILGIAGVSGNGQRELADAIYGLRARSEGAVTLRGRALPSGRPSAAIDAGLAYVPEDRSSVGLAGELTILDNLLMKACRGRRFRSGPFLRRKVARSVLRELLEEYHVKGTPETLVRQLSGGNAQRVLLARELSSEPTVLIVAAPTRGLDIAGMEAIRRFLVDSARAGLAVVLVSEDLDEVLDLADRVAIMCGGEVTGVVDASGADIEEIGLLMMGRSHEEVSA